jgi:hypothetical protein
MRRKFGTRSKKNGKKSNQNEKRETNMGDKIKEQRGGQGKER